jgi:hypothetical protein
MPKNLINDYSIYKIVCLDISRPEIYVGFTANFTARRCAHKRTCNNPNTKKYNYKVYTFIRANGGWDNFNMVEIKCEKQLTIREAEKITEEFRVDLNATLNIRCCYVAPEDIKEHQNQSKKKYNDNNKETVAVSQKKYKQTNKVKLAVHQKIYNLNHIEHIAEYQKKYKEEHKEAIAEQCKEQITCSCGCILLKRGLKRHMKTTKHDNLISGI